MSPVSPVGGLLLLAAALFAVPAAAQSPVVSLPETQAGVSLTVYNGGYAVVREVRPLDLARGMNLVRWEGVAAQIDPTTLAIRSLTAPGALSVREQNYQYHLIGTNSVLDAAVGQPIRLIREIGDETVVEEGVLLSQPSQGRIIRLDDGRILVNPEGTIELAALPAGLLSRPSLLWHLAAARAGQHETQVSYMTNGITWKADYVAVVDDAETAVDVTGWVTLDNQSGASYRDARLQLLAGDVRRVQDARPMMQRGYADMAVAEAAAPPFQEEAFFEYHLYTLDGTTTIQQRETKQMELLSATDAGVQRRLIFDGGGHFYPVRRRPGAGGATTELSAAVVLELENSTENQMGMPLPAGTVRVYKADREGRLQFLGEDRIDHTPRNERLRLYIGDAFDVVGTRRQVAERRLSDRVREITVEVEVRNRKETAAEVAVVERLYGDWTITEHSHDYETLDARTIEFPLTLGPDETATVRYTARIQH
ncbi:MAG: hypothetical protein R3181_14870 [Rubricoccaceae bacterium]|nr:hypothetical protein [Rubricoccaceae bacterium]